MKILNPILIVALVLISSAFTIELYQSWNISSDYNIKFSGTSANGTFKGLEGVVTFDPNDLTTANMEVSVDVNTISTGNTTKDKHAKGKSWFYAEKYPKIYFKSSNFKRVEEDYEVSGQLTLRGVEKEVLIPFKFKETSNGGAFIGKFSISRDAYGMEGPFFSFTVGDEFLIELNISVE